MSQSEAVLAPKEEEVPLNLLVLHTDGGCRPNPGPAGWGIHGYMAVDTTPKKGAGCQGYLLTAKGYFLKTDPLIEADKTGTYRQVTPLCYIDGFGSFAHDATNNVAELVAAQKALEYAATQTLSFFLLYSDSKYMLNGLSSHVRVWQKNGWKRQDGMEVANVDIWKSLVAAYDTLLAKNVSVELHWVKSHNDHLGNELADFGATLGIMYSRRGELHVELNELAPDGYWKYEVDRHPFMNHRGLYFNTLTGAAVAGEYYLHNHGTDDEDGKRDPARSYAVVQLKEPDPIIEELIAHQVEMAKGTDHVMTMRLDSLYSADTHRVLAQYGAYATIQPTPRRLDLEDLNERPLTREKLPPRLVFRSVEHIEQLKGLLDAFKQHDPRLCITDLSPILYERSVKKDKKGVIKNVEVTLKKDYGVGTLFIELLVNYAPHGREGTLLQAGIKLALGIDILDRNGLRRIESHDPKVSLITWMESEYSFRYATVIECREDIGIWSGVYSNLRVITQ